MDQIRIKLEGGLLDGIAGRHWPSETIAFDAEEGWQVYRNTGRSNAKGEAVFAFERMYNRTEYEAIYGGVEPQQYDIDRGDLQGN